MVSEVTVSLEDLAEKADDLARKFREPASVEVIRGLLQEAGVVRARNALEAGFGELIKAQGAKRDADAAAKAAKDTLDRALVDADWALVAPDVNEAGAKLLAADKAAWKAREARRDPRVAAAEAAVRNADHEVAVARDALTVAEKRLSALGADLTAAVATLNALALALPAREAS